MITQRSATAFSELLSPKRLTEVVDIGANPIDGDPPYTTMLSAGLCRVTGFEPQEQALNELLKRKGPNERYLPFAVGDGERHTLNICRYSGWTSLYEPDITTISLFEAFKSNSEVVEQISLQTQQLDNINDIQHLDFLKIDIQGSELSVFQGGKTKLSQTVVIQSEVPFVTLYKNQPTLGDIDQELRKQGFIPHCFAAVKLWPISPCVINNDPAQALNQLLEADMVYVRDLTRPELLSDEQIKHLALVAHHCYKSFDLALRCVMLLEQRKSIGLGSQQLYLQLLSKT